MMTGIWDLRPGGPLDLSDEHGNLYGVRHRARSRTVKFWIWELSANRSPSFLRRIRAHLGMAFRSGPSEKNVDPPHPPRQRFAA